MPTSMVHGSPDIEASHSMTSFLSWLMSPQDYMPHGMCFLWQPELIALHVASDSLIALAYYSIPIALIYFVMKRTDLAFPSHFRVDGSLHPCMRHDPCHERLDPVVSGLSGRRRHQSGHGAALVGTAVAIWKVMPLALAFPSTAQLERANRLLGEEIGQRQRAEAALREANAELERRVAARTADLQEEVVRRRNTEATLRASEERWRSMFEASAVGITVMDQQNHFAAVNEAFQKMVGYTERGTAVARPGGYHA